APRARRDSPPPAPGVIPQSSFEPTHLFFERGRPRHARRRRRPNSRCPVPRGPFPAKGLRRGSAGKSSQSSTAELARGQRFQQWPIRLAEWQGLHLLRAEVTKLLCPQSFGGPSLNPALVYDQVYGQIGVLMKAAPEPLAHRQLDSQLLPALAHQRLFIRLRNLDFASGKFPEQRALSLGQSLLNQVGSRLRSVGDQ